LLSDPFQIVLNDSHPGQRLASKLPSTRLKLLLKTDASLRSFGLPVQTVALGQIFFAAIAADFSDEAFRKNDG
jgi:hypothetical protein